MHELLAVCFWVIDRDSLARPEEVEARSPLARDPSDEAMIATLDRRYVEHDAFALYGEIMKSAKAFYEWRAEEIPVSTLVPTGIIPKLIYGSGTAIRALRPPKLLSSLDADTFTTISLGV